MQCVTKIKFTNLERSAALETQAHKEIQQLEHLFPKLQSCDVTFDLPHKHQHHGVKYEVRLHAAMLGVEFIVDHQSNEDAYIALRDAFSAARRKLHDFEENHRSKKNSEFPQ